MSSPKVKVSKGDYLALERKAMCKSEFYNGGLFAMAGVTKEHNKIVASLIFN